MNQKLWKKFFMISALLIGLHTVFDAILNSKQTEQVLRGIVNREVIPRVGRDVKFEQAVFRLLPLRLEVSGLRVLNEHDEDWIVVQQSSASIAWWSLLMGSPQILDLNVSGVQFHSLPEEQGENVEKKEEIEALEGEEDLASSVVLPLHKIYFDDVELSFQTPPDRTVNKNGEWFAFIARQVSGELSFDGEGLKYRVETSHFHMQTADSSMAENAEILAKGEMTYDGSGKGRWVFRSPRLDVQGRLEHTAGGDQHGFLVANDIRGTGDLSVLGSWLDIGTTRGHAQIDARVEVLTATEHEDAAVTIDGRFHLQDGYIDRFHLHDVSGALAFHDQTVSLRQLQVSVDGERRVDLGGEIHTDSSGRFDFQVMPQGLLLSTLMDALRVRFDVFDAELFSTDSPIQIQGTIDPFHLKVSSTAQLQQIHFKELKQYGTGPLPQCDVTLDFAADAASFRFGDTKGFCSLPDDKGLHPDSTAQLQLSGEIEYDESIQVLVNMKDLGPALFAGYLPGPLGGDGQLELRVEANKETDPVVSGTLGFERSILAGVDLGAWSTGYRIDGGVLSWQRLKGRWGQGHYESDVGSLRLRDLWLKGDLEVFHLPEATYRGLAHWLELPVTASLVSTKAQIEGPLLFPLAMTGKLEASVRNVATEENFFCDDLHLVASGSETGWTVSRLQAELGTLAVLGRISVTRPAHTKTPFHGPYNNLWERLGFPLSSKVRIQASSKRVSGRGRGPTMVRLPFVGEFAQKAELVGQPSLDIDLEGNLLQLQGTVDARVTKLSMKGALSADWEAKGFVEGGHLDLTVRHGGRALNGRMSMDLFEDGIPYKWYVRLDRFDIRSGFPEVFHKDPRNFAYLTADWEMRGQLASWWASEGMLAIEAVQLHYAREIGSESRVLEAQQARPVKILFSRGGWATEGGEPLLITGPAGELSFRFVNHRPPENFGIEMASRIELSPFADMVSAVESGAGAVHGLTRITGALDDLQLRTKLWTEKDEQEVSVSLPFLRPMFREIELSASLNGEILTVHSFQARKGSGFVNASGRVNLGSQGPSSDFDISFQHAQAIFPVPVLKSFEGTFSGDLHVTGRRPFDVKGRIQVERGRTAHQFDLRDEITQSVGQQRLKGHEIDRDPLFRFDVVVKADRSIYVQNRNLQMLLSAELTVQGVNSNPSLNGHVYVHKGKLIYKREFEFVRGDLVFDDTVSPLPTLDVIATASVAPYQVTIAASGSVSDLDIQLTADPPTREDGSVLAPLDILVLLSRGSLPGGTRNVVGSAASSEALNLVLSQLEQPLETLAELTGQNFFHLYIDTLPDKAGPPVPRLNGTFNLSKNLDVVIRGGKKGWTVSAEMPLHESVSTSMNYSTTEDDVGGDVENAQAGQSVEANLRFRFSFE